MNPARRTFALAGLLFALLAGNVLAQETSKHSSVWLGTLDVQVAKLRLQLNLKQADDGSFTGAMISLDQGSIEIPFDTVSVKDKAFEFTIKKLQVEYKGKLDETNKTVTGNFTQRGQTYPLEFKKLVRAPVETLSQVWKGKMKAGPQEFDFQFRVYEDGIGGHVVKLDSFTEKITVPCTLKHEGDTITITVTATQAKFVGKLDNAKEKIEGKWIQSGLEFPLTLTKVDLDEIRTLNLRRPQTPQPPFKYNAKDFEVKVSTINKAFDKETVLAGTLTTPKGDGPFPTVIMISGSGPQDRDETIMGHRPFFVFADHLTKKGYAVIRFDDRGIAKSKGDFATATSADFSEDVEALVGWAKTNPKLDANKIILCGHSEGGLIAPMVAARNKDVAGIILLAGPGVTGKRVILNQSRKIAAASGASGKVLAMQESLLSAIFERLESRKPADDEFTEQLKVNLKKDFDGTPGLEQALAAIDTSVAQFNLPWMKYFLSYDPVTNLSKTDCPVLAIVGGNDLQVDPELNQPEIEAALKTAGNDDVTMTVLPKLNHLFQTSKTGSPSEYNKIEETVSPVALDAVTGWLDARFK